MYIRDNLLFFTNFIIVKNIKYKSFNNYQQKKTIYLNFLVLLLKIINCDFVEDINKIKLNLFKS